MSLYPRYEPAAGRKPADPGYKLVAAGSAEEAQHLVGSGLDLDVLVTDHLMRGRTGTELAREVHRRRPRVRVLVISGCADVDGIDRDLPRPVKRFRQEDLARILADAVIRPGRTS